jgi:hypothetical protein
MHVPLEACYFYREKEATSQEHVHCPNIVSHGKEHTQLKPISSTCHKKQDSVQILTNPVILHGLFDGAMGVSKSRPICFSSNFQPILTNPFICQMYAFPHISSIKNAKMSCPIVQDPTDCLGWIVCNLITMCLPTLL